jgi:flagellar hook assembly protein FlgD
MTASQADTPDNLYGYGIINALDAVNYFGITGIPDTTVTIDQFALYQNYPNPFNPDTKIEFDIFSAGNVEIAVYNLLGQKIKTLFNGYRPTGPYYVMWDGRNASGHAVSSGVYFYRLEAKNFSKTKKMLLVK